MGLVPWRSPRVTPIYGNTSGVLKIELFCILLFCAVCWAGAVFYGSNAVEVEDRTTSDTIGIGNVEHPNITGSLVEILETSQGKSSCLTFHLCS